MTDLNAAVSSAPVLTLSPEMGDKMALEKAVDALNELKTPAAHDAAEAVEALDATLTEDEKKQVMDFAKTIDITNPDHVMLYGADAQKKISSFADTVLGYDTVIPVNSSINLQNGRARYALYPVWILNTKWGDQNFTFAVNGQTGKTAGDLPLDKGLFRNWFLGVTAAVAAAAFAVSYLFWLL